MNLKYHDKVYEDREDSWLLQEVIKNLDLDNKKIIDIGTGTGIQAITAARAGAKVIATDINPNACNLAKENSENDKVNISIFCSDLFKAIKPEIKFDYIFFNSPYLPVEEPIDPSWSGGKEIIFSFLEQAKEHTKDTTRIIFVFSSLTNLDTKNNTDSAVCGIENFENKSKVFNIKILASKKFMQEVIYVGELCRD